ncbi:hypothetical protein AB833_07370 [Chromatiales bacterium (ex Bugula neritina AB1)]|nr:hypothetical protein AB833_07370 [Chromatiales bacterium (ex Bugula neritina AB1)]
MTLKVTIVGVGLIGGSFSLALQAVGADIEFTGCGRNEDSLLRAVDLGIVTRYSTSVTEAVAGSDLVFLATPVGAMEAVLAEVAQVASPETIITDAGSCKQSIIGAARRQLSHMENFVAGHPIAGTEHSGVEAGFATLYRDRRVILTPQSDTSAQAIETVRQLWIQTGAQVEEMSAERHDKVFAATSHLPHLLAFSLVETLYRMEQREELLRYAAGGFSDFTRIASSDPVMWRDVCLHNSEAVLESMANLREGMDALVDAINAGDGKRIEGLFKIAKDTRDTRILAKPQQTNPQQNEVSEGGPEPEPSPEKPQ